MSDEKLILGAEPGLFGPITVVIKGVEYTVTITYPALKKILDLENNVQQGSIEALTSMYDEAVLMTGCTREVIEQVDVREIRQLIIYVADQIFRAPKKTTGAEKNGSGPGESK